MARSVATSIASMEYEVRLNPDEPTELGTPPFIVQVDDSDWAALSDVLDEIVDEQREFDRRFEMHHVKRNRRRIVIILTLTGVVEALVIFGLIEM